MIDDRNHGIMSGGKKQKRYDARSIKMGKYFGTDGFRGEANINLTVEHAYKVGRYIGWYFNQKSSSRAKIVIGKGYKKKQLYV